MHLCKCGCIAEYTSNEDRNICLKYIFDKLKDELDKELFNNFFGFSSILYKNFKNINKYNICIRALPIWSIFFNM